MILLYQPPSFWGIPSISPFCVKLETYLKMAGIQYKIAPFDIRKAPKGKIPFIEMDGKFIGDSGLIIDLLKKKYGDVLDKDLSAEDQARAVALQRLVEEHLYFAMAWLRWNTEDSLKEVRKAFLTFLPPVIGGVIFNKIRKDLLKSIYTQGMGRHSRAEIIQFAKVDFQALSILLGDKPFFLGSAATSIDAVVYGFLVQTLHTPWESEIKQYLRTLSNLVAFDKRMKEKIWSS